MVARRAPDAHVTLVEREPDLAALFENEAERAEATRTGRPVVKVLTGPEAQKFGAAAPLFYSQGRVFADYLLDRTGQPAVFASISEAFARGDSMDTWLAREGRSRGLPTSVAALDRDWRGWLRARLGPPAKE